MSTIAVIFFSKDRPLQLDSALRSFRFFCKDCADVSKYVITLTTSDIFRKQYKQVEIDNPDFIFVEETDIILQLLEIARPFDFVSFHCDDNIYIRSLCFAEAVKILADNDDILTYSFRLAPCIVSSYNLCKSEIVPNFNTISDMCLRYNWVELPTSDFSYPLEFSASVYRCSQLLPAIDRDKVDTVASAESYLNSIRHQFSHLPFIACGTLPSMFTLTVNRVGANLNKFGIIHNYATDFLRDKFSNGYVINIDKFKNIVPDAVHMELELEFERTRK